MILSNKIINNISDFLCYCISHIMDINKHRTTENFNNSNRKLLNNLKRHEKNISLGFYNSKFLTFIAKNLWIQTPRLVKTCSYTSTCTRGIKM